MDYRQLNGTSEQKDVIQRSMEIAKNYIYNIVELKQRKRKRIYFPKYNTVYNPKSKQYESFSLMRVEKKLKDNTTGYFF